ncbi:MAG TPA: hypothetical protein VME17_00885 [Bryobacteraceae bacterium]|nr:hypothetical protein [Bryobacteraceae bacterium]
MFYFAAIVGLTAALAFALLIRERSELSRRSQEFLRRREKAEQEKSELLELLSHRDRREAERFSRLEHDLRSSISIAVGFSSLLKESLDKGTELQPAFSLKCASGILESVTRTLKILDAAVSADCVLPNDERPIKESDESPRRSIAELHSR